LISRPRADFSRLKGVTELALLDAVAQAELVRRGEVSATELVEDAISRIESLNPALNAVIFTSYEDALARAATRLSGRLAGVPYLLKNLIVEQAGTPFTESSRFLAGNVSTVTSELVQRLERAGLIVLGRTNTPEFGLVPTCEPVLYGPPEIPGRQRTRPAARVAVRLPRWHPEWSRWHTETTSAARSATPPRPVACSG
jgi:Asp-tRNA(Asn)/Glu-tRNA(Gln) amidotransferase A subunit family amidase